jgi:GMP synthase-like glutamine amidotransferase
MQAHFLQHVPFEGLGSIEAWLLKTGYTISSTPFFSTGNLPKIREIDLLVIMGGPMSVNDETEHPWLIEEKIFIQKAIEAGKPVLGICLGAQLIASAMGAEVIQNPLKEIGWFPIQGIKSESSSLFSFPDEIEVFHWHGETFRLPPGAVQIARSDGCENQAFQIDSNVIGLQFHLETTPDSAQAIVKNCREELVDGRYIQSEREILTAPQSRYSSINKLMQSVLEYLHSNDE